MAENYVRKVLSDSSSLLTLKRFCQGLADTRSPFDCPKNHRMSICYQCPYLSDFDNEDQIINALDFHLTGKRVGGSLSANPYARDDQCFHITFYERLDKTLSDRLKQLNKSQSHAKWKIGTLYGIVHPKEDDPSLNGTKTFSNKFRQSAFTVSPVAFVIYESE